MFLRVLGFLHSWKKLIGCTVLQWVGCELLLSESAPGLSASRGPWLMGGSHDSWVTRPCRSSIRDSVGPRSARLRQAILGSVVCICGKAYKLRECYGEVEDADEDRKEQCAVDFAEEHWLSEADHRACRRAWRCHHCHRYPLECCIWRVSSGLADVKKKKKKQCNWLCAACGGQYDWKNPKRIFLIHKSTDRRENQSFPSARCATWRT